MTKVTILGQYEPKRYGKKIEFLKYIKYDGTELVFDYEAKEPSYYDEIKVIKREGKLEYDIFLCYKDGTRGTYLGHFNDGIV